MKETSGCIGRLVETCHGLQVEKNCHYVERGSQVCCSLLDQTCPAGLKVTHSQGTGGYTGQGERDRCRDQRGSVESGVLQGCGKHQA